MHCSVCILYFNKGFRDNKTTVHWLSVFFLIDFLPSLDKPYFSRTPTTSPVGEFRQLESPEEEHLVDGKSLTIFPFSSVSRHYFLVLANSPFGIGPHWTWSHFPSGNTQLSYRSYWITIAFRFCEYNFCVPQLQEQYRSLAVLVFGLCHYSVWLLNSLSQV